MPGELIQPVLGNDCPQVANFGPDHCEYLILRAARGYGEALHTFTASDFINVPGSSMCIKGTGTDPLIVSAQ